MSVRPVEFNKEYQTSEIMRKRIAVWEIFGLSVLKIIYIKNII